MREKARVRNSWPKPFPKRKTRNPRNAKIAPFQARLPLVFRFFLVSLFLIISFSVKIGLVEDLLRIDVNFQAIPKVIRDRSASIKGFSSFKI